jgi:hypothetical protein
VVTQIIKKISPVRALPFTSTLHVPLFSQGLLSHGETRNKNGKKCYYSESNTRTTFRMKTFAPF